MGRSWDGVCRDRGEIRFAITAGVSPPQGMTRYLGQFDMGNLSHNHKSCPTGCQFVATQVRRVTPVQARLSVQVDGVSHPGLDWPAVDGRRIPSDVVVAGLEGAEPGIANNVPGAG